MLVKLYVIVVTLLLSFISKLLVCLISKVISKITEASITNSRDLLDKMPLITGSVVISRHFFILVHLFTRDALIID